MLLSQPRLGLPSGPLRLNVVCISSTKGVRKGNLFLLEVLIKWLWYYSIIRAYTCTFLNIFGFSRGICLIMPWYNAYLCNNGLSPVSQQRTSQPVLNAAVRQCQQSVTTQGVVLCDITLILKRSLSVPQGEQRVSMTTVMLFREIISVYSENHAENISTLCG